MDNHTEVQSKVLQESTDMFIGEGYALQNPSSIPGFKETTNFRPKYSKDTQKKKKKNLVAKFFSNMSRMGMRYEEDAVANMRALPADKSLIPKPDQFVQQDLFAQLSSSWKVKNNQDKNFFEKDFQEKREALRKLALQPELEDILDTMTNESIVYDSDYTYFAEPLIEAQELGDLVPAARKKVQGIMTSNYRRFYKMLNWKYRAWDDFKRFLIEGNLSWEIVYDDLNKPTKIIGLIPVDAATLTRKFKNNKWYWVQFSGIQGRERTLLDSQIIYIAYQETGCVSRTSYLERLIRPFNIYRIIEQAQLIWTITNSSYKMKFTIPIKGMNKVMGMQTLSSAMNKYKEDIKFLSDSGELQINGQVNMPFNKEYWFPESESGSPSIETLGGEGPELNDNDQLKYFKNQLYKISKIPLSRFDQESGETWFGSDPTSATRAEIEFARFVTRLRNQFSQIIIKPLQLQLALSIPELQDSREILEAISLKYHSYNLFEEMMDLELTQKRIEFIQSAKESLVDMDMEGNEIKFFSSKFLVQKYLQYSPADLALNEKLKKEEIDELNLAGDPDNAPAESLINQIANLLESKEDKIETIKKAIKKRKKKVKNYCDDISDGEKYLSDDEGHPLDDEE